MLAWLWDVSSLAWTDGTDRRACVERGQPLAPIEPGRRHGRRGGAYRGATWRRPDTGIEAGQD